LKEGQRKKGLAENNVPKELRTEILEHIELMHRMITTEHFLKYWELFKKKYSNYSKYCEYFEKSLYKRKCQQMALLQRWTKCISH